MSTSSAPLRALANMASPSKQGKGGCWSPSKSHTVPQIKLPPILMPSFDADSGVLPLQDHANAENSEALSCDNLTPRLLEAMALLDANIGVVDTLEASARAAAKPMSSAADDDEEPAWLKEAATVAAAQPSCSATEPRVEWDDSIAGVKEVLGNSACGHLSASHVTDALRWIDNHLATCAATSFPQLDRLVVAPGLHTDGRAAAVELLRKRDALLLLRDGAHARAEVPAIASALSSEIAREESRVARLEAQGHHLRSSAEAQARTTQEILSQLELTRSAAKGTQQAARRIVDDHERDVALLIAELRRLSPEAAASVEGRLSAPLEALAARKRHAAASAATRRQQSPSGGMKRSMSFDRFSKVAADVVSGVTEVVDRARRHGSPFRAR